MLAWITKHVVLFFLIVVVLVAGLTYQATRATAPVQTVEVVQTPTPVNVRATAQALAEANPVTVEIVVTATPDTAEAIPTATATTEPTATATTEPTATSTLTVRTTFGEFLARLEPEEQAQVVEAMDEGQNMAALKALSGLVTDVTCHVSNTSSNFPPREDMVINGTSYGIQVWDPGCPRAIAHIETGIAKGDNYALVVPAGWSVAFAAVSCAVHPEGATEQVEYASEPPFIVIRGPWAGSVGCYEAGVHGTFSEWEPFLLNVVLPLHEAEVSAARGQLYRTEPIFLGGGNPTQ